MAKKKFYPELITLLVVGALMRFWALFSPSDTVFDEVYFKAFSESYLTGLYYFDIHPPLGKLLYAGFAALTGVDPMSMNDENGMVLRIVAALFGLALIPLVWLILRRLGVSRLFAFVGGAIVLLDNAILVQSRFVLLDSMLIFFILFSFYAYLTARQKTLQTRQLWLALAAVSAGCAASVKWTGLSALLLLGIMWLFDNWKFIKTPKIILRDIIVLVTLPIIIYIGSFWLHFQFLPDSGEGDAFMSQQFQATLKGSDTYNSEAKMPFWNKFYELNREMYVANSRIEQSHPYSSAWYTWPLQQRPMYYWADSDVSQNRNIYLLGNPVIWWGIIVLAVAGLAVVVWRKIDLTTKKKKQLALLATAYAVNFLPFIVIGRVMFLYHYLTAFIISIIFVTLLWSELLPKLNLTGKQIRIAVVSWLAICALGFIYFAPLSYGTQISEQQAESRRWLDSW